MKLNKRTIWNFKHNSLHEKYYTYTEEENTCFGCYSADCEGDTANFGNN